jgi:S1-C subfamily serine protease
LKDPIATSARKSLVIRNSDLSLEENLRVFGYPRIGGESLTVSVGIVSGLDQTEKFSYFKVTADISSGNSGGPVVDSKGQLVGIASAINRQEIDCSDGSTCYAQGNGLGLVRPISLLKPLLSKVTKP